MSWDEQKSTKRVKEHDFQNEEINVSDLAKTMDFSNLGVKDVRRAEAAHLYVDVSNFHLAVDDAGGDKQEQRKLIRAASVLRRVQGELVDEAEAGKIQMQAARFHGICYRPYDDEARRVKCSVTLAITLQTYLYDIFNPCFPSVRNFRGAVGIDSGRCLIANLGYRGERERICLGTPANLAAKIIGGDGTITLTEHAYGLLPDMLKEHFKKGAMVAGAVTYKVTGLRWSTRPDLAEALGVTFKPEKWQKRTEEYRDGLKLDDMQVSEAEALIDVELLSECSIKRTEAVAVYADLDGFTKAVQEAEDDETVVKLVRDLHMFRHEFHAVINKDFGDVVVQHQGDCMFAIVHLPSGSDEKAANKRRQKAVDAAIGIQSSMEHVLLKKCGEAKGVHVAIGVDAGRALVTRLGKKGKREVVCLGPEVTAAQDLQQMSAAKQIRISEDVYNAMSDDVVKKEFKKDGAAYVATGTTFPSLDEKRDEAEARAGVLGASVVGDRVQVSTASASQSRPWSTRTV